MQCSGLAVCPPTRTLSPTVCVSATMCRISSTKNAWMDGWMERWINEMVEMKNNDAVPV